MTRPTSVRFTDSQYAAIQQAVRLRRMETGEPVSTSTFVVEAAGAAVKALGLDWPVAGAPGGEAAEANGE